MKFEFTQVNCLPAQKFNFVLQSTLYNWILESFTMIRKQSKIIKHTKKQENITNTQEKSWPMKMNPQDEPGVRTSKQVFSKIGL